MLIAGAPEPGFKLRQERHVTPNGVWRRERDDPNYKHAVPDGTFHTRPQKDIRDLEPGKPIEREMAGEETHTYRVRVAAGQYLRVIVNQQGIDVVVRLIGANGHQITEVDSPNGTEGPEPVSAIAEASETYLIEVQSLDTQAAPGRYDIRIEELREAKSTDQTRIAAERAFAKAGQLQSEGTAESLPKAIREYEESLQHWRAIGDHKGEADTLMSAGFVYWSIGENRKALEYYNQALPLKRMLRDRLGEAKTLNNIAVVYHSLGNPQEALGYYLQALPLLQSAGEQELEAATFNNIGGVYDILGKPQKAVEYYNQALALQRAVKDRASEAQTLTNIGVVYDNLGESQRAIEHYTQALPLLRDLGDRRREAYVLSNAGVAYLKLGESLKVLEYLEQALALQRIVGDRRGETVTLNTIGFIYHELREWPKALDSLNQALALQRVVGDQREEAHILRNIGLVHASLGEPQQAIDNLSQSLTLRRVVGDRPGEAKTLRALGDVYTSMGQIEKALDYYDHALQLGRAVGDRRGEAETLFGIARAEQARGRFAEARARMQEALDIIESLRTKVAGRELRASYLASKQNYYDFYIDLLMRLHQHQPSEGHDAAALQASERARARNLLETLVEAHADIRQGIDPKLIERERTLQQQLNAKADRFMQMLSSQHTQEQATAAKKEIETLLAQYQEVQAQIRVSSPRYAALTQPQPLGLSEIQQQVLDEDTLLLEYSLGEERSFLWAVTPTSLSSFELPKRAEIDAAARQVYELLTARNKHLRFEEAKQRTARIARADAEYVKAAAALSQMILGPVAGQLEKKRLLIVADGMLRYVPFGALPKPDLRPQTSDLRPELGQRVNGSTGQRTIDSLTHFPINPLIVDHEIVTLPSASVLAVMRRELAGRKPAAKTLAVLADPVFESSDHRVKLLSVHAKKRQAKPRSSQASIRVPPELKRSADGFDMIRFERLPNTRREAAAILTLVPPAARLKALDFDASRTTATSAGLSQYRMVHFATHGLLNTEHPELSGIVLSLIDKQGQPQDGFLRAHEIYNLTLPAELVVLSGCKTGLGKEIRGEGLVGLTRGFMYAGAARVAVSLWDVNDAATAELMKRFYRAMLVEGLRPAAALRAAQVSLWKQKQWRTPYYWAAFQLQGEWK